MPLRILLLEDSAADADLITAELRRHDAAVEVKRVTSRSAFTNALHTARPDAVLSDHGQSAFSALAALELVREVHPSVPVIVLSGSIDEHMAAACVRAGAENVLHKRDISALFQTVAHALEMRKPFARLTARQLQVLRFIAEGQPTASIASTLAVTVKTVENHRTHIMTRMGVHDAASLVRIAAGIGLIARR
ncbi:MAG: response regulator transcription factor [bacterium]